MSEIITSMNTMYQLLLYKFFNYIKSYNPCNNPMMQITLSFPNLWMRKLSNLSRSLSQAILKSGFIHWQFSLCCLSVTLDWSSFSFYVSRTHCTSNMKRQSFLFQQISYFKIVYVSNNLPHILKISLLFKYKISLYKMRLTCAQSFSDYQAIEKSMAKR